MVPAPGTEPGHGPPQAVIVAACGAYLYIYINFMFLLWKIFSLPRLLGEMSSLPRLMTPCYSEMALIWEPRLCLCLREMGNTETFRLALQVEKNSKHMS